MVKATKEVKIKETSTKRPPVVVIMGHIDHGKSTLLDYIRKTRVTETEAGGITQHVSAYEATVKNEKGQEEKITFIDTPGHEAFSKARARGAVVADIAVLVVAADDGVNTQTIEATNALKETQTPFIVAITKIDKPGTNVEQAKSSLVENNVYIEGYGGDISCVSLSAKTGEGVSDLLEMILLTADLEELKGDTSAPAAGVIIESNVDPKKGMAATLLIKNGTLRKSSFVVSGEVYAPVRILEDFQGKTIQEATFSSPVRIIGWNSLPQAGENFVTFATKKEALQMIASQKQAKTDPKQASHDPAERTDLESVTIPLLIKTDVIGTRDGVLYEIDKLRGSAEGVKLQIIFSGVGEISENDVLLASGSPDTIILGFHVRTDPRAATTSERKNITIKTFDVIYEMSEWLGTEIQKRKPSIEIEESVAKAKIMRVFSHTKNAFVAGGKVMEGTLKSGSRVKIARRDAEIGHGKILELQQAKVKANTIESGAEFGIKLESKTEIVAGDTIEIVITKQK